MKLRTVFVVGWLFVSSALFAQGFRPVEVQRGDLLAGVLARNGCPRSITEEMIVNANIIGELSQGRFRESRSIFLPESCVAKVQRTKRVIVSEVPVVGESISKEPDASLAAPAIPEKAKSKQPTSHLSTMYLSEMLVRLDVRSFVFGLFLASSFALALKYQKQRPGRGITITRFGKKLVFKQASEATYRCPLCSIYDLKSRYIEQHVVGEHPELRIAVMRDTSQSALFAD